MRFLYELYTDARVRKLRSKSRRLWMGCRHWLFRRQCLMQRMPWVVTEPAIAIGSGQYVLTGWLYDPRRTIQRVLIRNAQGLSLDITGSMIYYDDARLRKKLKSSTQAPLPRFMVQFSVDDEVARQADPQASGGEHCCYSLVIEKRNGSAKTRRIVMQAVADFPLNDIRQLLNQLPVTMGGKRKLFDTLLGPAITQLWSNRPTVETPKAAVVEYNAARAPSTPAVSLVIPVYGRFDFIEHQLSRFSTDEDMRRHDIIFVLDDPRLDSAVRQHAFHWAHYFDIAFRIVYLGTNLGYAGANNRGVEFARAPSLLLLNSDVLPRDTGWVTALVESASGAGDDNLANTLMGARLLYEDQTIQHDGMKFYASPFLDNLWTNTHPNKGLPTDVVSVAAEPFEVEAVTGACLLIARERYLELGGFDEHYILGDFEDSDLCLRARSHGMTVKQNSNVVLYHLERQSQSLVSADQWKSEITYYNCWYHTQLWSDDILALQGGVTGE